MIGGGYTGLSSALFLVEAGYNVVVLEAARIGFGASGRNGGQLVNSYSRDIDVIEERYGAESARLLGSMMFEGAEIIRSRISRYAIDCDYRPGGIFAALNNKQFHALIEQKRNWERYGNTQLELLDADRVRQKLPAIATSARCSITAAATSIRSTWRWARPRRFACRAGASSNNRR